MAGVRREFQLRDETQTWTPPLPGDPYDNDDLPLHDRDVLIHQGDKVVITNGEQRGWTGVACGACEESGIRGGSLWVQLTRPDGTRAQQNVHRRSYVAKLVDAVPRFDRLEDAETWLAAHDRTPRQLHADGAPVLIESDRGEVPGKVVGFIPYWDRWMPGYKVLVVLDGDPTVVEVMAHRVQGA